MPAGGTGDRLSPPRHPAIGTSKEITQRFLLHHLAEGLEVFSVPFSPILALAGLWQDPMWWEMGVLVSIHGNEAELEEPKQDRVLCQ